MSQSTFKYWTPLCFSMALALILGIGAAAGNAAEKPKGYMDPLAVEVLENVSDHLARAKAFSMKAKTLYDHVLESGVIVTFAKDVALYVQRPDKFLAIISGDNLSQRRVFFDGKSLVRFDVNKNTYQKLSYEGDIDQLLDYIIDNYDLQLPLADFIYNDIANAMKESIISSEYLGERIVGGAPCHHLSFESTGADWQLWVQKWDKPIPRRFTINYVNIDGNPQYLGMFEEWRLVPGFDERMFTFKPPPGAKEVELKKAAASKTVQ